MTQKTFSWKIQKTEIKNFKSLGFIKELSLSSDVVALTNVENKILAIPGVAGGEETKATTQTRDFLVEVANFDPEQVARNSFKLNYRSDANKLFAGNINPFLSKLATVKLMNLLSSISSNNFDGHSFKKIQKIQKTEQTKEVDQINGFKINWNYICSRLDGRGNDYWKPIIEAKIVFLGNYQPEENILYPNIFYGFIQTQEDFLEEVIRLIGFENLEPDYISFKSNNQYNSTFDKEILVKQLVANHGYVEVITRPFVSQKMLFNNLGLGALKLQNPYSSLEPFYRDNLETSLLKVYAENLNRGQKNIQIFEINEVYSEGSYIPKKFLTTLIETNNPYKITTLANSLNEFIGLNTEQKIEETEITDFGQITVISDINNIKIIQISNKTKKIFNIPLTKVIWTLSLDITDLKVKQLSTLGKYKDTTQYPSIQRNYSYQVNNNLSWQTISKLIKNLVIDKCEIKIKPIERFAIDELVDKLNFEITYYSYTQTLSGDLIESLEVEIKSMIEFA